MYQASESRYDNMIYNRVGNSGLKLPAISLGLWHNFGDIDLFSKNREMVRRAFDLGVTHFDLANNYGPPPGSAEENFGRLLQKDFLPYRDELIISSKAGFYMRPGPHGDWGSKKNLTTSIDQSLKKLGLDYLDIYYHHRPDPETNLEETAMALDLFVKQGKALYIGISNYDVQQTKDIMDLFADLKTPFIIHQPKYSMYHRIPEEGLFDLLQEHKKGSIVFSPLAQGMLTDRYLEGIPQDSRASRGTYSFFQKEDVSETLHKTRQLQNIAENRNQTLAQMAIAWVMRDGNVTSVLIGASKVSQLESNIQALNHLDFSLAEREAIEAILTA